MPRDRRAAHRIRILQGLGYRTELLAGVQVTIAPGRLGSGVTAACTARKCLLRIDIRRWFAPVDASLGVRQWRKTRQRGMCEETARVTNQLLVCGSLAARYAGGS